MLQLNIEKSWLVNSTSRNMLLILSQPLSKQPRRLLGKVKQSHPLLTTCTPMISLEGLAIIREACSTQERWADTRETEGSYYDAAQSTVCLRVDCAELVGPAEQTNKHKQLVPHAPNEWGADWQITLTRQGSREAAGFRLPSIALSLPCLPPTTQPVFGICTLAGELR